MVNIDGSHKKIELRPYQKEAIEKWLHNGCKGILSMATGTGKTIIAIEAIKEFIYRGEVGLIIVPTKTLLKQWYRIIKEYFPRSMIVCCYSGNTKWKEKLRELARLYTIEKNASLEEGREKIIISTMGTSWKKDFKQLVSMFGYQNIVVVIDEVHRIGAIKYRDVLNMQFKRRLGLSATPTREWDYKGTKMIERYFGGVVYNYPISQAIKDGFLTPYKYYIEPVSLTIEEIKKYLKISEEIKKTVRNLLSKFKGFSIKEIISMAEDLEVEESTLLSLQNLFVQRRRIIKKCENKYATILKLIEDKGDEFENCLIYCEDYQQLDKLKKLLLDRGESAGEYTARMNERKRDHMIDAMKKGHVKFLLSCKSLDEGVDIPSCDAAILMANSSTEREFIQRRGRLLRLSPKKKFSIIFDLIVVPYVSPRDETPLNEVETKILEKEIDRVKFFAKDSLNAEETLKNLKSISILLKI